MKKSAAQCIQSYQLSCILIKLSFRPRATGKSNRLILHLLELQTNRVNAFYLRNRRMLYAIMKTSHFQGLGHFFKNLAILKHKLRLT